METKYKQRDVIQTKCHHDRIQSLYLEGKKI